MLKRFWHRTFLRERPSIGLGLFRMAVAFTAAAHVIPTFVRMEDNYLSTAFKEKNGFFFTPEVLWWVDQSADGFVWAMAGLFVLSVAAFGIGLFTQASGILMMLCLYFFYAMNSLHIGTLSFDILLVTVFLMVVTPYPGDSLSVDAWRRTRDWRALKMRPFFIQRLLQLQIAWTYLYTALWKIVADGNWLPQNPMYFLFNSTAESVVKQFPGREFLAARPDFCYAIGIAVILFEISLSFLIFWKRTRYFYIAAGWVFHILLVVTLHVPTIFLFLFPPQFLLFIEPERMARALRIPER